jgi:acyl carrier protein
MTTLEHAVRRDLIPHLLEIWRSALGVPEISPDDSFFDLGGDSLMAIQVIGRINATFGLNVRPVELVSASSVALLAETIKRLLLADVDPTMARSLVAELRSGRAGAALQPEGEQ